MCISYVLYYPYMDLFPHVFHMFLSYLINKTLILECSYWDRKFCTGEWKILGIINKRRRGRGFQISILLEKKSKINKRGNVYINDKTISAFQWDISTALVEAFFKMTNLERKTVTWNKMTPNFNGVFSFRWIKVSMHLLLLNRCKSINLKSGTKNI